VYEHSTAVANGIGKTMGRRRKFKVPHTSKTYVFHTDQLVGENFRDRDLRGVDFHNVDLRRACFEGANLTGANLRQANLEEANLRHARLEKADLTDANMRKTQLWQTRFSYAKTRHTDFRGARNLSCLTGRSYNATIHLPQLRMAITDMNYHVWQKIWRSRRASLWSLVAIALAVGGQSSRLLAPPWDRWAITASVALLGLSLAGLARAHYRRRFKTSCYHD
jgi:Pentapeptide repeats (8 copies)